MTDMMMLYDVLDELWSPDGLLKVVRKGYGFEWHVFGQHNYNEPLFSGSAGEFFEAQKAGEAKLTKDLHSIFMVLNAAASKERSEGESKDAELIEQVIRNLNAGNKAKAVYFLDRVIGNERKEQEPGDVARLKEARTLIMANA